MCVYVVVVSGCLPTVCHRWWAVSLRMSASKEVSPRDEARCGCRMLAILEEQGVISFESSR